MTFRTKNLKNVAAWLCLACVLPSMIWRIAMISGVNTGFAFADMYQDGPHFRYVLTLEALQLIGGLLSMGLTIDWTMWLPRWVPLTLGALGNAVLYLILGPLLVRFSASWLGLSDSPTPADGMSGSHLFWFIVAYVPLFFWPVCLSVALYTYYKRAGNPTHA